MANIAKMMKQAQEMQARMQQAQDDLGKVEVEGASGGGMIKVIMTGKGDVRKITIDPSLVDKDDITMLEDLVVAAMRDAKTKVEKKTEEEMAKVTGGLNLPPGMKLPF